MRTFLGRITSPVKSLAAGLWQKQRKKELYELRMGSMELPAPGVSKLIGVSRTLLEAVPGAARQNHRQGWTILPLVNWVLSLGTNASGHKPGAAQREESQKARGLLQYVSQG